MAITSPTAGCGKTMVAVNTALSIARQSNSRAVLIDLDLRRPAVAHTLGIKPPRSIAEYLRGSARLEDCFVRLGDSLFLGLNTEPVGNSSDIMHGEEVKAILPAVIEALAPTIVIFDLPPILSTNDSLAFLPHIEACALVVGSGQTTPAEIEESERHLSNTSHFLGVILNKAETLAENIYTYDPT